MPVRGMVDLKVSGKSGSCKVASWPEQTRTASTWYPLLYFTVFVPCWRTECQPRSTHLPRAVGTATASQRTFTCHTACHTASQRTFTCLPEHKEAEEAHCQPTHLHLSAGTQRGGGGAPLRTTFFSMVRLSSSTPAAHLRVSCPSEASCACKEGIQY